MPWAIDCEVSLASEKTSVAPCVEEDAEEEEEEEEDGDNDKEEEVVEEDKVEVTRDLVSETTASSPFSLSFPE